MARLAWKDVYATGVPSLDFEHRVLIDIINASCDSLAAATDRDAVTDSLDALYKQACAHFALEERVMRESGYGLYAIHKSGHEKLIDSLRDMMDSFDEGRCGRCKGSLDECLVNWFDAHFRVEDGRLERMEHVPLQAVRH